VLRRRRQRPGGNDDALRPRSGSAARLRRRRLFQHQPAAGNYLATHWNTANSSFLQDDDAPQPAQLSLTGASTVTYGDQATLGSRLTDEQTTAGLAGDKVNLFARQAGTAGELGAGTATTATDGAATFTPTPAATTTYRASFPGSDTYGTATSAPATVTVRPTVTAHPEDSTVTNGETVTVTGKVAPQPPRPGRLPAASGQRRLEACGIDPPEQGQHLHPEGQAPVPGHLQLPGRQTRRHRPRQRHQPDAQGDRSLRSGGPPR
jgi:hypothetical protein